MNHEWVDGLQNELFLTSAHVGVVSPNRRKFRHVESWPRAVSPAAETFHISRQIRKDGTPPWASRRVPDPQNAPRQPSKAGKYLLAGRLMEPNSAWRNFRRFGLTTPTWRLKHSRPGYDHHDDIKIAE
jgi:hypothetical protein